MKENILKYPPIDEQNDFFETKYEICDTIVAQATAAGRGAIGIVRLSGPQASYIALNLFSSPSGKLKSFAPRFMHYGHVLALDGAHLDEALAVFMPGPNSYTGQDTVEFHTHGSPPVMEELIKACLSLGARPAERGEFTLRAFLNDKMDLSQAEAVAEIINAPTAKAAQLARGKLEGSLGRLIHDLREKLLYLRSELTLSTDFPEEEIEDSYSFNLKNFLDAIQEVAGSINKLIQSYKQTRPWREGVLVVLAGEPNAGKSSLLNALLGRPRALVSPSPGTTRDFIEEFLDIDGLPIRLTDTAGLCLAIREQETKRTSDENSKLSRIIENVEEEGQRRARLLAEEADFIIYVQDGTFSLSIDPEMINFGSKTILAINKSDLPPAQPAIEFGLEGLQKSGISFTPSAIVRISAKTGAGLETLLQKLQEVIAGKAAIPASDDLVPGLREKRLLEKASEELHELVNAAKAGLLPELLAVHLETSCIYLAEITGQISSNEVLEDIFSRFCLGK